MHAAHTANRTTGDELLQRYLRDVSRYPLMNPALEKARAMEHHELRIRYHKAVLSHAPLCAAALVVVTEGLDASAELDAAVARVRETAAAARGSNRRDVGDAFTHAVEALATELAKVDAECLGADRIAADLESLAAGQRRGISMALQRTPKPSCRFNDYVGRVGRTSAALRASRNRFARANLRLVVRIASRFQRSGLSLHDRVQEGNLGLMKAVDRFDPTRGFRFSTYASYWIKHAIRRAVVNRGRTVRVPAHLQALAAKLVQTRRTLHARLGRDPTRQEIAAHAEVAVEKVQIAFDAMAQRPVSLDADAAGDERRTIADSLAAPEGRSAGERIDLRRATATMRGSLLRLDPMERDILRQRFGLDGAEPRTLTEIGGQYALSRERIRQLQNRALERMREAMA